MGKRIEQNNLSTQLVGESEIMTAVVLEADSIGASKEEIG